MARREIAAQAFLAALPLFRSLGADGLARLAEATTRHRLVRGQTLFARGDAATAMYVVVYGEIHLISRTPVRGERLTGVVGPGRSFGEPVMFLERPALVEARAASDSLVLRLPREAVFAEIERNPRFARRMLAGLSQRIEALVRELDRQSQGGARWRLADYLLRRCAGSDGPQVVTLPAPKAAIASHLNLTPEHFSRVLHELASEGLLQVHGRRITLPDPARLAVAVGPG
ncbi:MAG: Crp/Fnr family transcriptional regulator [Betaproteobacteria bacterium]